MCWNWIELKYKMFCDMIFGEKVGDMMTLQEQVVQKVNTLSEDNLQFLLDMMNRFMQSDSSERETKMNPKRIGIAKGQNLYDNDYYFYEMNHEIAVMVGGVE